MDLDGRRNSESTDMDMDVDVDVDDGVVSRPYPPRRDSLKADSARPSGARRPFTFPLPNPDSPAEDGFPPTMPSSSQTVNHLESGEVTHRKRKHADLDDTPDPYIMEEGPITDSAHPPLTRRRVRPRLGARPDREFSPLLIMPEDLPAEDTISAIHTTADPSGSHSIGRYFDFRDFRGPRILPSSSEERRRSDNDDSTNSFAQVASASTTTTVPGRLSTLQDLVLSRPFEEATHKQSSSGSSVVVHGRGLEGAPLSLSAGRSDSASSFAEVALASMTTTTTTVPRKQGRLSTLQDLALPRPFEDTASGSVAVAVHERGPEAGPSFLSTKHSPLPALEPILTKYFDQPLCESPDSISPDEERLRHHEMPTIQVAHVERHSSESIRSSHGKGQ